MRMLNNPIVRILTGTVLMFFFISCAEENQTVTLAEQYGLAYAAVSTARLKGWFEEEVPGTEFKWQTAGNAATVREAILAGKLDVGFMGIPPYLIGKDRGMKWTAAAAVARAELGLVTVLPGVKSLAEIPGDMRIALPQPGSIQHILLAMAADRELGDAGVFDNRLVTLSHPDGMTALMAGSEVKAHFTSPPYLQKELKVPGARLILDGNEAFGGEFTFIIAVFSDDFIKSRPIELAGIQRAIQRGAEWLNENPDEAAGFLADYYRMEESELGGIFHSGALFYGGEIRGMDEFRDFMLKRGYLKNGLRNEELILP